MAQVKGDVQATEPRATCPICGEAVDGLRSHMDTHKPPICPHCQGNGPGEMRLDFDEVQHPQVGKYFYHAWGCGRYS
jgi:hypothetical protein